MSGDRLPPSPIRVVIAYQVRATLETGGRSSFRARNRMSNSVTIPIGLGGSLAPSEHLLEKFVDRSLRCLYRQRSDLGKYSSPTG